MVQECLQPVFEQHKLSKYGFLLKQITHPLATSKQHYFKTAWVFADTRSPLWAEVNDVFFNPHAKPIDDDRVGVALGYPEVSRSFAGESKFSAVDLTEMGELEVEMGRRVCSVRAFDFRCGSEHFGNLVPYFERCAAAAKEVGTVLRM
ncbi:uncharacterized protein LY89DRAFT_652664 [Mollisia scopiformis]|uniref:Uncharacterized protein n=1 Tax=Mollisia scopiformis TaxID=149040 RepID=A0A194WXF6_MOLSC|nr:uncharacterized protein LY89DRAFT_652664 [Mollisia scopiformis]KUJ12267.1 hypothetical protein LY89DRAFT_652664 [Mollisia scopiformis]